MQQPEGQPLYMDTPKPRFNLPMILASGAAVLGVFTGFYIFLALGPIGMVYTWLTTHRQYIIYPDSLVIVFGRPRKKAIPFSEIETLETLTLTTGETLGVRLGDGKRIIVAVANVEEFKTRMEQAMGKARGAPSRPPVVEPPPEPQGTTALPPAPDPEPDPGVETAATSRQPSEPDRESQGPAPY